MGYLLVIITYTFISGASVAPTRPIVSSMHFNDIYACLQGAETIKASLNESERVNIRMRCIPESSKDTAKK